MTQVVGFAKPEEARFLAVVTRCGCDPATFDSLGRAPHTLLGQPCPNPAEVSDLGTVAYWHRSRLRRWAWALTHLK